MTTKTHLTVLWDKVVSNLFKDADDLWNWSKPRKVEEKQNSDVAFEKKIPIITIHVFKSSSPNLQSGFLTKSIIIYVIITLL